MHFGPLLYRTSLGVRFPGLSSQSFSQTLLHTVSHAMHEDSIYKVKLNPIAISEADEQ
jgi:hypothetical protein